ncbi:MAG TPA: hypothetical protein VN226_01540 [Anaerolineales bacterium]|nr:hypothetical protein [Anaerolineales bacterium]
MKLTILDRLLFLATGLLSGYIIAFGIEGFELPVMIAFTISFGVMLIASLMIIIIGYEILENSIVVIAATLVPLGLAIGLVILKFPQWFIPYLIFALVGFSGIIFTRVNQTPGKASVITLAVTHAISGLTIVALPIYSVMLGQSRFGFVYVAWGGSLIGLGGLLLMFIKMKKPILSVEIVMKALPWILTLMMFFFSLGLRYAYQ